MTPRSFRLEEDPPTVKVEAAYSKRRRDDVVILHPSIADRMKQWLTRGEFASKELLFPICHQSSGLYRKSSKMIQLDLAAARNQWIYELGDRSEGERSDFLAYKNQEGKYADFHCLRHTFITNLCRANVSPKIAQTLARHSDIQLTLNVYTHVDQEEQVAAIGKLEGWG